MDKTFGLAADEFLAVVDLAYLVKVIQMVSEALKAKIFAVILAVIAQGLGLMLATSEDGLFRFRFWRLLVRK